jgi:hypothetical protein
MRDSGIIQATLLFIYGNQWYIPALSSTAYPSSSAFFFFDFFPLGADTSASVPNCTWNF